MRALTWIDPDGIEYPFTPSGPQDAQPGVKVVGLPPIRVTSDVVPFQPGARRRQTSHGVAEVAFPAHVQAATPALLEAVTSTLQLALDPTRGDGRLVLDRNDGTTRELTCRYKAGFEVVEPIAAMKSWICTLIFEALDPYWYDVADRQTDYSITSAAATFFPFFPLRLASSEVFATGTILNDGQVEAWPVWTITGPGSNLVLRNLTTGKVLSLTATLLAGERVTIDTRPGFKTVTKTSTNDLFGSLSDDSSLWSLARGSNSIQVELTGATAASAVSLRYRRRWLSA